VSVVGLEQLHIDIQVQRYHVSAAKPLRTVSTNCQRLFLDFDDPSGMTSASK
jgi:hypothetical protein